MQFKVLWTIQIMMKNKKTDLPSIHPMENMSSLIDIDVPDVILPFFHTYCEARESETVGNYRADKELVKKWKKEVKKSEPTFFETKVTDDDIVEYKVSAVVDDAIYTLLKDTAGKLYEESGKVMPSETETEYLADIFVRVTDWTPVIAV